MTDPYYADDTVTLWHGDMRHLIADLAQRLPAVDAVVTDPPYGETSLPWDRWPNGWIKYAGLLADSMWCFGSMRMFAHRWPDFLSEGWAFSQDVVWAKHAGSSFHADRFRRVHEHATFWYRGLWGKTYHDVPTTPGAVAVAMRRSKRRRAQHMGDIGGSTYTNVDGGPLLMHSVLYVASMHGKATHPTEKPVALLDPLIRYACPPGGTVLDPFAGSGSTAAAARLSGRRAVLIEADERYCEAAAERLQYDLLAAGVR